MGIICRIPNWWKRHAYGVSMTVSIGEDKPPLLGMESILSMRPQLTVDGVPLSREEIEQLLAQTEGLAWLKGKWVEVDHAFIWNDYFNCRRLKMSGCNDKMTLRKKVTIWQIFMILHSAQS